MAYVIPANMHLAPDTDFLPLTHDKPATALTPCSVPKAACPQNRLQSSCPQTPPLAQGCSLVRLHEASASGQRLSSHYHQAWWPWGFPMVKVQHGDTDYCAEELEGTCTTGTTDLVWKGKERLLLLLRHNLALCFLCSFWSTISLPFSLSTANLL